jgi:hypothetical protein
MLDVCTEGNERRGSLRYPVSAQISYVHLDRGNGVGVGRGRVLNISSRGVLFESNGVFSPGMRLELVITWPGESGRLVAKVVGRVVRVQGTSTALVIEHYEFQPLGRGGR